MIVKLLTEHHLEFPSLKGGCRGSSESTLVEMSNCWKSHATAQLYLFNFMDKLEEHMLSLFHSTNFDLFNNWDFFDV